MKFLTNKKFIFIILPTLYQWLKYKSLKKKGHKTSPALENRPQQRGWVMRVRITTPRKPNSARRATAKINLSNKKDILAYIPGVSHNLRRYSTVLVRGGGARDLPNVGYTCIRGIFDFAGLKKKTKRRSIYGVKWPEIKFKNLRRKDRVVNERLSKKKLK